MPHPSVRRNTSTEVWGAARPAWAAYAATKSGQRVRIQLQANGRGSWKTLSTVTASKANGYFDTHVRLPSSGKLRLQYTYPKLEPFLPIGIQGSTVVSSDRLGHGSLTGSGARPPVRHHAGPDAAACRASRSVRAQLVYCLCAVLSDPSACRSAPGEYVKLRCPWAMQSSTIPRPERARTAATAARIRG